MNNLETLLSQDAVTVAEQLIGYRIYVKESNGSLTGGTIIETEAYHQDDAASHSYKGETPRNSVMFGPAGHVYVYFTYGRHYCMNIVTGTRDRGEGVLLRALRPETNIDIMQYRRGNRAIHDLTNGPAKLCQALAVTKENNGAFINGEKFVLLPPHSSKQQRSKATPRIGIKENKQYLWRFISIE